MAETNALAKLAEDFAMYRDFHRDDDRVNDGILTKVQLIVAELAKVENPIDLRTVGMTHLADILEADKNRAVEIVRNCRLIAMEGAGDDQ